jgi:SP family sugar porter-like MFS transporter
MSVAVLSLWIACTAFTFTFPLLNRHLGPHGAFWLYGATCVLGWFGIGKHPPVTKGKSLEDI